jgi:soluble lytic murein transglycosylase
LCIVLGKKIILCYILIKTIKQKAVNKKKKRFYLWFIVAFFFAVGISLYYYLPNVLGDTVYPLEYESWIVKYSAKYNVDPALVAAVIMQESRFNPKAQSGAGAQGLMQFMPGTAATMAKETGRWPNYDIFDAETSIEFGAAHIRDLLIKYNNNVDAALVAYNTGTGNTDRNLRSGLLDRLVGNSSYAQKVKNYQKVYATMYAKELSLDPIVVEKKDTASQVRGFVWTQIFSNFANVVTGGN